MEIRYPLIKMNFLKASLLALLAPLLIAAPASAAVILWDAAAVDTDTSNAIGQVSTAGTLFAAVDIYSSITSSNYTVNTVTFTASNANVSIGKTGSGSAATAPGTGTYTYASILDGGAYNADASSPSQPIQLSNLLSGHSYQLQLWTPYWNGEYPTRFSNVAPTGPTYTHAVGESPSANIGFNGAPTFISQYVLGTFTADVSGLQSIYYYGDGGYGLIGALQVRDLSAVPEPSTFALAGLGGLALILRRRSRQRKLTA